MKSRRNVGRAKENVPASSDCVCVLHTPVPTSAKSRDLALGTRVFRDDAQRQNPSGVSVRCQEWLDESG